MFLHASSICAVLLSLFWPWGAAQGVLSGDSFEAAAYGTGALVGGAETSVDSAEAEVAEASQPAAISFSTEAWAPAIAAAPGCSTRAWMPASGSLSTLPSCDAQNSLPDTLVVKSPALHCADTVLVYSPLATAGARDLPTLILLHGWSGSPRNWAANMDIQGLSDEFGFRIICPDGFKDSWYMNKTDSTSMRWRDFFWDELWPMLDSRYGLKADRVFTDGLSMGGHGAMNLFLDHPERMRGAGSMSGVLNLRNSGGSRVLIPPMLGVESIEDPVCDAQSAVNRIGRVVEICVAGDGSVDADSVSANSAKAGSSGIGSVDDSAGVGSAVAGSASKLLIVSCGLQDKTFLPASQEFEAKAAEQGLRVIAQYTPGKHRWPFWCWALRCHLEWFRAELSR